MIKVTGLNEVLKDFKKMDMDTRKVQVSAVRSGINRLKDGIRQAAPVKRGILKKNIKASVKTYSGRKGLSAAIVIDTEGQHWIPVEFGHSHGLGGKPVPPHPFVYNTRDRLMPSILNDIEAKIDGVLTKHGAR